VRKGKESAASGYGEAVTVRGMMLKMKVEAAAIANLNRRKQPLEGSNDQSAA